MKICYHRYWLFNPPRADFLASEALLDSLSQLKEIEVAQFDMLWLKRLYAMMEIVRRGILILAGLLSLAVLLIIGNTIRLAIYNRREVTNPDPRVKFG